MKLEELQALLAVALTQNDADKLATVLPYIDGAQALTPPQGVTIYRDSISGQLCRTLQDIYPVCCRLVGDAFFEAIAHKYVQQSVSRSADLGDYGEQFPTFLAQFPPVSHLPYLADVARLEWHWHRVFHSDRQAPLDLQALGAIPQEQWGDIIFHLPKPSVLLSSRYPIHRIWQVNQPEDTSDGYVDLEEGESRLLLWRKDFEMRIDLPNVAEWQLLQALRSPQRFEEICDRLAQQDPTIDVGTLMPKLVQFGWIADFSLDIR